MLTKRHPVAGDCAGARALPLSCRHRYAPSVPVPVSTPRGARERARPPWVAPCAPDTERRPPLSGLAARSSPPSHSLCNPSQSAPVFTKFVAGYPSRAPCRCRCRAGTHRCRERARPRPHSGGIELAEHRAGAAVVPASIPGACPRPAHTPWRGRRGAGQSLHNISRMTAPGMSGSGLRTAAHGPRSHYRQPVASDERATAIKRHTCPRVTPGLARRLPGAGSAARRARHVAL